MIADSRGDVWVTCDVLEGDGFRTLTEGDRVAYTAEAQTMHGGYRRATNVQRLIGST